MHHRRSVALIALLAVAVAGGAASWRGRRHHRTGAVDRFPRWAAGVESTYKLTFGTRIKSAASQTLADFGLDGSLAIAAVASEPEPVLRVAFSGDLRLAEGTDPSGQARTLSDGLRRPFFLHFDKQGRLQGLRLEAGTPDFVEQIWQALGAVLQTSPAPRGDDHWIAEESDNVGLYEAEYTRVDGAEADRDGEVVRKKRRYVDRRVTTVDYQVGSGTTSFKLDDKGDLASLSYQEVLTAAAAQPIPAFESSTQIDLVRTGTRRFGSDLGQALAAALAHPLVSPGPKGETPASEEIETAKIAGRELPDLLAALIASEAQQAKGALSTKENDQAGRAYVSLTARLRRYPEELAAVAAHIRGGGPLTNTLTDALRDAGTPEAQQVLRDVVTSTKIPAAERFEAARALSMVSAPTSETATLLDSLRGDPLLKVQATYGVGSNAYRLASSNPSLAETLVGDLVDQLHAATTGGERAMVLTALGNAGAPQSIDAIVPYLTTGTEEERLAAARGLRRVSDDAADTLLAKAALSDESGRVRASAMDAISERSPTQVLVDAVARAVTSDRDFQSRTVATRTAGQWVASQPSLRSSLESAAANDPEADIRRIAQQALDRLVASK